MTFRTSTHFVKSTKNTQLDFHNHAIRVEKYLDRKLKRGHFLEWMSWNGAYVYAYGCLVSGIVCAIISPIMNQFQGGNLYPYFSEVIRSGFNKFLFVSGCSIGFIPSLLFSANYLKTSLKYGKLFKSMFTRVVYNICQVILYILFLYSIFSVIGVSLFDMDNFPNAHTVFSSSWVFITNLMEILQLIIVASSLYRGKRQDSSYLMFKSFLSCLSCFGMINFVILGSYVPCHSHMMTMEECLLNYDEDFCFRIKLTEKRSQDLVMLRQYNHCPILHPIRGYGEFVAVVCTMFYLITMVYDLKMMASVLNIDIDQCQGECVTVQDGEESSENYN